MKFRWIVAIVFVVMLAAGASWFMRQVSRTSSFFAAAYAGQTDVIAKMIKNGESIDTRDPTYHATALIYAAQEGHIDTVKFLLDNHADINAMSKLNQTALTQAAAHAHLDVVKLLLERGAKVNEAIRPGLMKAAEGHPEVLKLLQVEEPVKSKP